MEELSVVSQDVFQAFAPQKPIIESLGNTDAHVHWHVFPRRIHDTERERSVCWMDESIIYSETARPTSEELRTMKLLLQRELDKLLYEPRYLRAMATIMAIEALSFSSVCRSHDRVNAWLPILHLTSALCFTNAFES